MKNVEIRVGDIVSIIILLLLLFQLFWKPETYYRGYSDGYRERVNQMDKLILENVEKR